MHAVEVGELARHFGKDAHFAAAALVDGFQLHAVAKGGPRVGGQGADVGDGGAGADVVIGYVAADAGDAHVVA